jgi:uncharacterized membrane protein
MIQKNKIFNITATILLALFIIAEIMPIFTSLTALEALRITFGSIYVLFLPGFIISYIFFPKTKEFDSEGKTRQENRRLSGIDWIERIALSFALSIAIVPLAVFYLNLIGLKINLLNSFLTILGILAISGIILYFRLRNKY